MKKFTQSIHEYLKTINRPIRKLQQLEDFKFQIEKIIKEKNKSKFF